MIRNVAIILDVLSGHSSEWLDTGTLGILVDSLTPKSSSELDFLLKEIVFSL